MDEDNLLSERRQKLTSFLKEKYAWVTYVLLAIIVFISVRIRTMNLAGLRDVTTGDWTLGPDLDPFLFLRWSKYIVENGSLFSIDNMRYVPIGFPTDGELLLHPYMMAWLHNVFDILGISNSVTYSAVLYPVFFFALTVIAFFFLVRKIFIESLGERKAGIIALISSFFLSVLPILLPRTIAGIPEKESAAFFFMFMSFYLFLCAWKSKNKYGKYVLSLLTGMLTAGMALVWGGFIYIFVTFALAGFIALLLGQFDRQRIYIYATWLLSSSLLMSMFSSRYTLTTLIVSTTTGLSISVLVFALVNSFVMETKIKKYFESGRLRKVPKPVISIVLTLIAMAIISPIVFGPGFILDKVQAIIGTLVTPVTDRLGVTVAENRQPYFGEWSNTFGPVIGGTPLFFWLFFIGSIYLFYHMLKGFEKKRRWTVTAGYTVFLLAMVFSRYSPSSLLNGENFISIALYFGGALVFLIVSGMSYYKYYHNEPSKLKEIDFGFIFLFSFFFFSIVSARGAVRLIMVLAPAAAILVSYFVVSLASKINFKDKEKKVLAIILAILVIVITVYSAYGMYSGINSSAKSFVPGQYNQQWQRAMEWVRTETSENSVFGHWWDYGYWVQTLGERATVLDGGNAYSYWNHLMGRYALTGPNEMEALEFLYAHNTTHFLIDSTDIGKYTAFSSIGSDEDYDRRSWIPTFFRDNSRTTESKNGSILWYLGGFSLDEDVTYTINGTKIFLPGLNADNMANPPELAGVGAVKIEIGADNRIYQPEGIFIYKGQQYVLPLRYAYYENTLIDFGTGVEAGIFLMPLVRPSNAGGIEIETTGALLYLSSRTVNSQLARFYLYGQETPYFKLVHVQDDPLVSTIKSQGGEIGNFAYFEGFRGPIKIWEINYPEGMEVNEEYLSIEYPDNLRRA